MLKSQNIRDNIAPKHYFAFALKEMPLQNITYILIFKYSFLLLRN
jgi:hypothetical protein